MPGQDVGQLTSTLTLDWSDYDKSLSQAESRLDDFHKKHADVMAKLSGGSGSSGGGGVGGLLEKLDPKHPQSPKVDVSEIERLGGVLRQASSYANEFGLGFEKSGLAISALELKAAGAGVAIATLGVAAASVAAKFIDIGVESEQSRAKLEAWGNTSSDVADKVESAFGKMSSQYGISGSTNLQAFTQAAPALKASGTPITPETAKSLMSQADAASVATGQDVGSTTKAIADTSITFKTSYKEAADSLTNISQLSGQSMGSVSDIVGRMHDLLGGSAPSLPTTQGLITQFTEQGLHGSRGVLTAESGLAQMLGGSPQSRQELAQLGISSTDKSGTPVPGDVVYNQVLKAMQGLNPATQLEALSNLTSPSQAQSWLPIIQQGVAGLNTAEQPSAPGAEEQAKIQTETAKGLFNRARGEAGHEVSTAANATVALGEDAAKGQLPSLSDLAKSPIGTNPAVAGPLGALTGAFAFAHAIGIGDTKKQTPEAKSVGGDDHKVSADTVKQDIALITEAGSEGSLGPNVKAPSLHEMAPNIGSQVGLGWAPGNDPSLFASPFTFSGKDQDLNFPGQAGFQNATSWLPQQPQLAVSTGLTQREQVQNTEQTAGVQAQAMQAEASGHKDVASALQDEVQALETGKQANVEDAQATVQLTQAKEQYAVTLQQNATQASQFGTQSQMAGIQGQPDVAGTYKQLQAQYASGSPDAVEVARLNKVLAQQQGAEQVNVAQTQQQGQVRTSEGSSVVASSQGYDALAMAQDQLTQAYQSGSPAAQAYAQSIMQVTQDAYTASAALNQLKVSQIGSQGAAIQTQTGVEQQRFDVLSQPGAVGAAMTPALGGYEQAAQQVQSLQSQMANPGNSADTQRQLGMELDQANANLGNFSSALENAKTSATGFAQAMETRLGQPSQEERNANVAGAQVGLEATQMAIPYISSGQPIPDDVLSQIIGLGKAAAPQIAQGDLASAERGLDQAKVEAAKPNDTIAQLNSLTDQQLPNVRNGAPQAALPSQVTATKPPEVKVTGGPMNITVTLDGKEIGKAYAQETFDGLSMDTSLAPMSGPSDPTRPS